MAKSKIPSALERRHLLERDLSEAEATRLGEAYLSEGRRVDAIAFFHKADAKEHVDALREEAVENGDAFLLREIARTTGEEPRASQWERLAAAAERAGKDAYAQTARRQAEVGEG